VVDRSGLTVNGRYQRLDPPFGPMPTRRFQDRLRFVAGAPAVDLELFVDGHEPSVHRGVQPGDVLVVD